MARLLVGVSDRTWALAHDVAEQGTKGKRARTIPLIAEIQPVILRDLGFIVRLVGDCRARRSPPIRMNGLGFMLTAVCRGLASYFEVLRGNVGQVAEQFSVGLLRAALALPGCVTSIRMAVVVGWQPDVHAAVSRSPPSQLSTPRLRWNEFAPEVVAYCVPQLGHFRKEFSCLCEIRKVLGAEGYDRRGTGCFMDCDDGDQVVLKRSPCRTQSASFGSSHIIHFCFQPVDFESDSDRCRGRVSADSVARLPSAGGGAVTGEKTQNLLVRKS
ncbi:hypothetical protein [Nocardia arthritidis]|uniref:hypothetical protein n=1 Tax=Nocardia arthritidis TaxID=228602 RepID=UPI0012EEAC95|nr:hypothetical protein [Nocardia arthritidis]